jgi:hypothetical protein
MIWRREIAESDKLVLPHMENAELKAANDAAPRRRLKWVERTF